MFSALWGRTAQTSESKPHTKPISKQQIIQINGLDINWRKSAQRKRSLTLKLDNAGQVIVMSPTRTHETDIRQFVQSRSQWIHKQLMAYAQMTTAKIEAQGKMLWFMGEALDINTQTGLVDQIKLAPKTLEVTTRQTLKADALDKRINKWHRQQADIILPSHLTTMSELTSLRGNGYQIKHYTARWGSCRHDGLIQLNWKLVMTPSKIIDYVALHELCHLQHFNHSPQFWSLLEQYCPKYKQHRQWLKQNGPLLLL